MHEAINAKAECSVCGRGVVVVLTSIGVGHQWVSSVVHAECLEAALTGKGKVWADEHPDEAADLREWLRLKAEEQASSSS